MYISQPSGKSYLGACFQRCRWDLLPFKRTKSSHMWAISDLIKLLLHGLWSLVGDVCVFSTISGTEGDSEIQRTL